MSDLTADELVKRGDKKMATTLTRWRPDYEAAATAYEEAGSKFRAKGRFKDAMIAFEKCAEANAKEDNEWHAAKHLEMCALLAKDCATVDETVAYARRACEAYVNAGRAQRGAECLGKCAKFMDETSPDASAKLLDDAIEMLEDDDKHVYAANLYRDLAVVLMRQEKHAEAAETMVRFGASCEATGAWNAQRKAYLSAIVASLYGGDGVGAQAAYADVCAIPAFAGSDEQRVGYALLEAYRETADAAAIQSVVKRSQELTFLEAPFARAAKRLPSPKHDLKSVSVAMGGNGGAVQSTTYPSVPGSEGGVPDDDDLT
jgi:26S proteasome regulatory subunit T4